MSSQISNNNNYTTVPGSPNPYISRRLNNMDQAQVMKKEREGWTRLYHKILKEIEAMIDVQRMVKNMKKVAEKANTTITEIEGAILTVSINNRTMNAMNIAGISEDLQYMVQSDMKERMFQIQRMLADKLNRYRGRGNSYVDNNIKEIQQLYIDEELPRKEPEKVEEDEVILIKPYKVSESILTKSSSFINEEINNLIKYMIFIKAPTQTRIFRPPLHYQLL